MRGADPETLLGSGFQPGTITKTVKPRGAGGPLPVRLPGCGSLRIQCSLIHADLLAAADYNVVGLAAAVLSVWAYLA